LKDSICAVYQTPVLENDGAVFNVVCDSGKCSPRNDQALCEMLRLLVSKNNLKFTVFIETPSKAFSDWTFPKVCQLYGISNDPNPDIDVFPPFSCGSADLNSDKSKAVIKHLMAEIKLRQDVTPLNKANEATKSIYSYCYLASGVSLYKDNFKLIPEKLIEGRNGQGNLDYAVECRSTGRVLGVIEVKKEDFMKGFAQASGKPSFKLSEPVTVVYKDENLQAKVGKVLGQIVWILEEAQRPVKVLEESSEIKRVRSTGDLTGKSDK
ncbi:13384_t:CDS:2, partial [Ambispora gerdemannii]